CGALSDSLLESELFGHQRGAFTGAGEAKPGMLELGDKGTVFLDEIGELPLHTQVKLLHALETGEVTRVGATRSRAIDVRYVAATNRDLPVEVSEGRFRRDLFFRINAISLDLPPLRQRKSEIEPLARHFLKRFCYSGGIAEPTLSREAVEHLVNHSWPGNVRELRNAVERAVILCRGSEILPRDLPDGKRIAASLRCRPSGIDPWESDTETTVPVWDIGAGLAHLSDSSRVMEAIRLCQGNQTRAAQLLGISRRTLVNRLNEYQLPRPRKRPV
ncbi:MAG TPA: sigma-54 dependent transcriptional regulator, partial [Polyangiaceae bacterium]|nr:sigma-54 dependent transcriptional regulator [Polyangiaceae bacterium]